MMNPTSELPNGESRVMGIAIVGCGYWGTNYVRVFNELPHSRVIAACDSDPERLRYMKRWFPEVQLTTEIETVLGEQSVDAVIICTPASTHHEVAQLCLLSGKHVLVEKPITTNVSNATELIILAESQRLVLMVGHTFLYNPAVRKLKEYIVSGDAGRIYYLYARRTNMGPIRQDVNALWDLSPHDISIFNYILDGIPEWVSAVGAKVLRNGREDVGFVSLGYYPDIIAHIHVSWADAHKVREVVVVGSDRRMVFNDADPLERLRVFHKGVTVTEPEAPNFGEYQLSMRDGDIVSPKIDVSEPLKNQCIDFLQCIRSGSHPLSDGTAGREVVRVMEAIDFSMQHKGVPVPIEKHRLSAQKLGSPANKRALASSFANVSAAQ
jgi:predicted dehydrogenase